MSKRDDFLALLKGFKATSPSITDNQRKGLLRQAKNEFDLELDEAAKLLKDSGLVVGEIVNYFEVLGFSPSEFDGLSESAISSKVEAAHKEFHGKSLAAGQRTRTDGRTEAQWRTIVAQARDTLKDANKRREHLAALRHSDTYMAELNDYGAFVRPVLETGQLTQERKISLSLSL